MKKMITLLAVAGMVLALTPAAWAALVSDPGGFPAPAGLNESDTYQLVFVSSTFRDATSNLIADYNTHVQDAANLAGIGSTAGVTWKAMASIGDPLMNANANAPVNSTAVYLVNGTMVASASAEAFWSQAHLAAININENGAVQTGVPGELADAVWTGTNCEGWRVNGGLGASGGVDGKSLYGKSDVYLTAGWTDVNLADQSIELPFYAVSQVLTVVTGGTPVPAGTLIMVR